MPTISTGSLIGILLPYLWMGALTENLPTRFSYFSDALVTCLLTLTWSAKGGEENNNFLPLRPMALVEGVSTRLGAGKGETSLYGV